MIEIDENKLVEIIEEAICQDRMVYVGEGMRFYHFLQVYFEFIKENTMGLTKEDLSKLEIAINKRLEELKKYRVYI